MLEKVRAFFLYNRDGPLYLHLFQGELAQLARALAWHARGHRFDSGILHKPGSSLNRVFHS
jgi:hypothetical protein